MLRRDSLVARVVAERPPLSQVAAAWNEKLSIKQNFKKLGLSYEAVCPG